MNLLEIGHQTLYSWHFQRLSHLQLRFIRIAVGISEMQPSVIMSGEWKIYGGNLIVAKSDNCIAFGSHFPMNCVPVESMEPMGFSVEFLSLLARIVVIHSNVRARYFLGWVVC